MIINLSVQIDPNNPVNKQQLLALAVLLTALGTGEISQVMQPQAEQQPKEVKMGKDTFDAPGPKVTQVAETTKEEQPAEEATQTAPASETISPENTSAVKLEDVRTSLGLKVNDHRDAIKAELTRLNAKNVSLLAAEHYADFKDFLDKL